ncbi:cordon-bleu protein-like 1b isoform X3 [Siphateles boraxobius]|uniref:cordon-bleu protein-like 1b isoform X3 n=1 Tax=Siphateles boraxobius TaxID=180520 RepID=UPI0040630410
MATRTADRLTEGTPRSSKSKAPPPPPVQKSVDAPLLSHKIPAYPHPAMDQKENLLEQDLTLTVVLPGGVEKTIVVHGSKPMMDLLVMLCAKYHLNPSGHTIELVTTNRNNVKFKPNALIGALGAEKILLKPKGLEDKIKRTGSLMPEATVRLVINYKKTQKTILRVSPRVSLRELLPAICEKCEFDPQTTVLLRNVHSEDTLDLRSSLNDFSLREVYARDTRVISPVSPISLPPSPTHSEIFHHGKEKIKREKENKRTFSLFRKGSKKQSEQSMTVSAPASPVHRKQRPVSMSSFSTHSPITYDSNTMPSDMPKKRRAPLPPCMMSQSMPSDFSHNHGAVHPDGNQNMAPPSRGSSTESSFKKSSTKRKAPPPPTSSSPASPDETTLDRGITEPVLESPLEEIKEQEEMHVTGAVQEDHLEDDSSLNLSADISLDSGRAGTASPSQDSEILDSGTSRDNPSCDLSIDAEVAEGTVNGEIKSDQAVSSHIQSEEKEPLVEKTEDAIQPSESVPVLEKVSVSTTEKPASLINTLPTSECGIQTLQAQFFDSDTVAASSEPSRSSRSENQMPETIPNTVNFTHTETHMQAEPQKPYNKPSSLCTEPSMAPSTSSTGIKRDIATSTEELQVPEPQTPAIQPSKDLTSTPASKAGSVQYIVDAEPKPKPSNELTREYTPKVGMTTYTIVPQKSLEKLRSFEVELTLEPSVDCKSKAKPASNGTVALNGHQNVFAQTSPCTLPPATASSPVEEGIASPAKDKKVPPATRPKPASFRLPQHKRSPGDYVISAAVRRASIGSSSSGSSCCSSPATRPKEATSGTQFDAFVAPDIFPPPPPPVQWEDEENARESDKPLPQNTEVDGPQPKSSRFPPLSSLPHQKSLPTNPTPSLSLEKLRTFAAPKPYLPSSPSRFAQAVSSAVKRSHSLSHHALGESPRTHPLTAQRSIRESPESPTSTVTDNRGGTERSREAPSHTAEPSSSREAGMGTCKIGNTEASPGSEASLAPSPSLKGISEVFHSSEE